MSAWHRKKEGAGHGKGNDMTAMEGGKTNEKTKKTDLHGTALHLLPAFYGFCAGIGGRNGAGGNDYPVKYKGSRYRGKRTGYD